MLLAQTWIIPQGSSLLGQTLEATLSWHFSIGCVDHLDGICVIRTIQHHELGLIWLALLLSRLVIVAKVWDALFLVSCSSTIDLILVIIACSICHLLLIENLFLKVFEIHLFTPELDNMVSITLVHISELANVGLDCLVRAHLGHTVREVVKVVLGGEVHVPLFVHPHYLVKVAGLMALPAQLQLVLTGTSDY